MRKQRVQITPYLILLLWVNVATAVQQIPIAKNIIKLQADYNQPSDISSDSQGQLYLLDAMNSRVVVLSPQGKRVREINTANTAHSFYRAMALAVDNNILYIADSLEHRIRRYSLQGKWLSDINLSAPEPENEDASKVPTELPEPVALLVRNDELVYSDRRWHRICYLELLSGKEKHCTGERGEMEGQFQYPFHIAQDRDGYLSVVDVINARVQVFDRSGRYYSQTGRFSLDRLYRPNGNTFDLLDFQYISDAYLGTISIYLHGRFLGLLQNAQGELIKFTTPVDLHYDPSGYLYVVDIEEHSLQKILLGYQTLTHFPEDSGEVSRKNCVVCHYSWGNDEDNEKLLDRQKVLPVASINMCYSCHHGAVLDSRQAIPFGDQHPTVYDSEKTKQDYYKKPLREDEIPELYPHSKKNDLGCTSCHTPHSDNEESPTLYQENENAWLRGTDYGSEQCEACHESNAKNSGREDVKQFGMNHPLGVKMNKPSSKAQHLSIDEAPIYKKDCLNCYRREVVPSLKMMLSCASPAIKFMMEQLKNC